MSVAHIHTYCTCTIGWYYKRSMESFPPLWTMIIFSMSYLILFLQGNKHHIEIIRKNASHWNICCHNNKKGRQKSGRDCVVAIIWLLFYIWYNSSWTLIAKQLIFGIELRPFCWDPIFIICTLINEAALVQWHTCNNIICWFWAAPQISYFQEYHPYFCNLHSINFNLFAPVECVCWFFGHLPWNIRAIHILIMHIHDQFG